MSAGRGAGVHIGADLPRLTGATHWLNGGPLAREDLLGNVVLIHFWSLSCGSCSEIMPVVNQWREKYDVHGVKMVGVHMPRSEYETDIELVAEAVGRYGLQHPIAVDSEHGLADAFGNKYVPSFYLFDRQGHLRHYQAGDRGMKMVESALLRVLGMPQEV
ncbi:MAG: redoxin family protein [Armatimonadota bacterium]